MTVYTPMRQLGRLSGPSGSVDDGTTGGFRGMLQDVRVAIAAIIMGGLVVLALFAGLVILALQHAEAAQLISVVNLILSALVWVRVESTRATVAQVQAQTDGQLSKLTDAALKAPAQNE